jgi:hypothetical protein
MFTTVPNIMSTEQQQQQQQQQQQHSLLSQASWGRLKMKPKRDEKIMSTEKEIYYLATWRSCLRAGA